MRHSHPSLPGRKRPTGPRPERPIVEFVIPRTYTLESLDDLAARLRSQRVPEAHIEIAVQRQRTLRRLNAEDVENARRVNRYGRTSA